MQAALDSIVCHTPLNNLGFSRKGSALTFSVAFQALRTGLFEVDWGWGLDCEPSYAECPGGRSQSHLPWVVWNSGDRGKGGLQSHGGRAGGARDGKGRRGAGRLSRSADSCLPAPAEPAHEAEAAVHRQRVPPSARGPAPLSEEQPQQSCCPGPGGETPGQPGPLSVLLAPTALPQPPHEVWKCGRGATGLGRG